MPPSEGEAITKKVKDNTFHWCAKCKRWTSTHTTATHIGKRKDNDQPQNTASLLELDPSAWCLSKDVDLPIVTRSIHARTQMLAKVVGIELNPEGDIVDHVSTLEMKVWEESYGGTINQRLKTL